MKRNLKCVAIPSWVIDGRLPFCAHPKPCAPSVDRLRRQDGIAVTRYKFQSRVFSETINPTERVSTGSVRSVHSFAKSRGTFSQPGRCKLSRDLSFRGCPMMGYSRWGSRAIPTTHERRSQKKSPRQAGQQPGESGVRRFSHVFSFCFYLRNWPTTQTGGAYFQVLSAATNSHVCGRIVGAKLKLSPWARDISTGCPGRARPGLPSQAPG
jgi:hypothetical protein